MILGGSRANSTNFNTPLREVHYWLNGFANYSPPGP